MKRFLDLLPWLMLVALSTTICAALYFGVTYRTTHAVEIAQAVERDRHERLEQAAANCRKECSPYPAIVASNTVLCYCMVGR